MGILSEGDLLRRAELATEPHIAWWKNLIFGPWYSAHEYVRSHARSVGSIMTREILCIEEETSLDRIVEIMQHGHVKRLPVVKDGKVVGIVSRRDLLKPLAAVVDRSSTDEPDDAGILRLIHQQLATQPWDPGHNLVIAVSQGVVQLKGTVCGDEQCQAVQVVIQNTPGVREIRGELVVLDPFLGTATVSPIEFRSKAAELVRDFGKVSA